MGNPQVMGPIRSHGHPWLDDDWTCRTKWKPPCVTGCERKGKWGCQHHENVVKLLRELHVGICREDSWKRGPLARVAKDIKYQMAPTIRTKSDLCRLIALKPNHTQSQQSIHCPLSHEFLEIQYATASNKWNPYRWRFSAWTQVQARIPIWAGKIPISEGKQI
jgi:hypothetical protein